MHFPVSGVDCSPLVPVAVAFAISTLTSPAGVSGAFLLLPFQMSVLGFTSPAVSATNLIFNLVAIPGGVYRYVREHRMYWRLAGWIVAGALPGMFLGTVIRARYLTSVRSFRIFVGLTLLYLGVRLLYECRRPHAAAEEGTLRPAVIVGLGMAAGLTGGIYGIGGGAIVAPFLVSILRVPVSKVAGATLFATFVTSAAGVGFFQVLVTPDWALGALFGLGGLAGTYLGARLQKRLPERWVRFVLGVLVGGLAVRYLV